MSTRDSPVTPTFSHGDNTMQRDSTQPSSPMADVDQDVKMANENGTSGQNGAVEDEQDMDVKAKALMHLLNTSEVRADPHCISLLVYGLLMSA